MLARFHQFSFLLNFFAHIFHLLVREKRVLNNELFSQTVKILIMTRGHSWDRITLSKLKKSNTNCSTDIFKNFNIVIWSPCFFVSFWISISDGIFRLHLISIGIVFRCEYIYAATSLIMTFESITMNIASSFENTNSTRTFSWEPTSSILNVHKLFWERAFLEIKVKRIEGNEPSKQHILCLLLSFETISKYKATLLWSMTVQIDVNFEIAVVVLLDDSLFGLINSWLLLRTWIKVESIEVVIVRVKTIVTSCNSVWVH